MKLVSLNIEGLKHLDRVLPFIRREEPDILGLQEVPESVVREVEALGYDVRFAPMVVRTHGEALLPEGVLYGVRTETAKLLDVRIHYLIQPQGTFQDFNPEEEYFGVNNACIFGNIAVNGEEYTIGITHFAWTKHGPVPSSAQHRAMEKLLAIIPAEGPHILCGDFNIPRDQNPLYGTLTEHYTDAVPRSYASSMDPTLHKLAGVKELKEMFTSFMVDYVFTQPPYRAENVRLEFDLSDHAGVIADILKD